MQEIPAKVYVLFECYQDGDGYRVFKQDSVHRTAESASKRAGLLFELREKNAPGRELFEREKLHPAMNRQNSYTFEGKRTDFGSFCGDRDNASRGFLIEMQPLL